MNNGIANIDNNFDSRVRLPIPINNTLRSIATIFDYPKGNNFVEGYYNDNSYTIVVDTTILNNLTVTLGTFVQAGNNYNPLTVDWGDGSYGSLNNAGGNTQRNGSFETTFIFVGTSGPSLTHTYSSHGRYIVKIGGSTQSPSFSNSQTILAYFAPSVVSVLSWGKENGLTQAIQRNNTNLTYVPPIRPPNHAGNYSNMFDGCTKFNHPNVALWDMSNATNLSQMFLNAYVFNQDIGNWNISGVTTLSRMFEGAGFNNGGSPSISGWNTSNVTDMYRTFYFTRFNQNIASWNTSNVTNMMDMFSNATPFNQSLDGWDVKKVTNFQTMFASCASFNGSLSGWQPGISTAGASCPSMFIGCTAFEGIGLDSWTTSGITNMNSMFNSCHRMPSATLNNWNTSNVTNMSLMFFNCRNISGVQGDLSNWNTSKVSTFFRMFEQGVHNTTIHNLVVPSGTTCERMFLNLGFNGSLSGWQFLGNNNCTNMFAANLYGVTTDVNFLFTGKGLGTWNTSGIVNAESMFNACPGVNFDASNWNTSNITTMKNMFNSYYSTPYRFAGSGLQNWDTGKVTDMAGMFGIGYNYAGNSVFNPSGIDNWNVSNVTNMNGMFFNQREMNRVNLSGWNICNVTDLTNFMFGCNIGSGNYSNLLTAWNNNKSGGVNGVKNWATNLTPHFGSAKYLPSASGARASLISYGWTITDGGIA